MKKPALEVTALHGLVPVEGVCTFCPDVKFRVTKPPEILDVEEAKQSLLRQFKRHFEQVHMREDASQAAARIV
ncbi:MAG: hypothetical protein WB566_05640, partial [Terriglobales bacterium]